MMLPTDPYELASLMGRRLDGAQGYLSVWDAYYEGEQPAAWLSPESAEALGGRLPMLSVNFARLAVLSLAERLQVTGYLIDGAREPDPDVAASWDRCAMNAGSDQVHVDALVSGRSYVTAWADEYGDPLITAESPRHVTTITRPDTRQVLAALKRYTLQPDPDQPLGQGVQVLMLPDRVITMTTQQDAPISAYPPVTSQAWTVTESLPNPLGVVPVVPFVNGYGRRVLRAVEGESELSDLAPLIDAVAKLGQDLMVTSETSARPRRWSTGLELREVRDPSTGEPVLDPSTGELTYESPFDPALDRIWQSEDTETKFGQFPQADLSPYTGAISTLTGHIGAISTLPAHYLGLFGDQPPSADSIRAAEASITSRAMGKQRLFSPAWAQVAALEIGIRTGRDPRTIRAVPQWADPSTRTPDQSADAAVKLGALGVPLPLLLRQVLGWDDEQVAAARSAGMQQALDRAALNLATETGAP